MLTLLKAGVYTTVQDNGRDQGAHLGIPLSGAMDSKSAEMVNLMLANHITDALLECTFMGPKIKFHLPTLVATAGAEVTSFLNDKEIDTSKSFLVKKDDVLSFGKMKKGIRFYIGVKGGFSSKVIYNSRSTCATAGILQRLNNGAQLKYSPYTDVPGSSIILKRKLGNTSLNVYKGPEFSILTEKMIHQLLDAEFTVLPSSNRMAYRVSHTAELNHSISMLSAGILPGTIQLTPAGDIICLMRDAQTTGGYPRILQLTEESICDLSQLRPNERFSFQLFLL